jgi:oligopeptide transport system permease protein
MLTLILRRLLAMPLILAAVYTITLSLAWLVPGNPLENPEGRRPLPEIEAAMKAQYNLDSFPNFYFSYLASATGLRYLDTKLAITDAGEARRSQWQREDEAARQHGTAVPARPIFDFGPSLQYRDRNVNEIIASSLPVSIALGLTAVFLAAILGVTAGVVGALKPNSFADLATLCVSLVGISLPSFVIGSLLLLVFGVWLAWLPVGGWGELRHFILPACTLCLPFAAYISRLTRMGMIEQLSADYIRTARAKGLPERTVVFKHALKNAFLPVLSYLGPACAMAMTGSFVVERVFSVPGMGQRFVNAVQNKDLFLIIGVVLIFSTLLILFNLAVDVLYRWVDPRIQ